MCSHKVFHFQDIARSNYHLKEDKTRINIVLSAILLTGLIGVFVYL